MNADPNYSDHESLGTGHTTTAATADPNGNDWGPPPQAAVISEDGASICIDPPAAVHMTLHVIDTATGEEVSSLTFPYVVNDSGLACVDWAPPPCTTTQYNVAPTWDLGVGVGPVLSVEQAACPVVVPEPTPVVPTPVVPVELAPPVTQTATPVVTVPTPAPTLPVTGAGEILGLAAVGIMLAVVGASVVKRFGSRGHRGIVEATR